MTEIATRDGNGGEMDRPTDRPFRDSPLVQWAYEARQAAQVAESLAKTSFVPQSLRGKPFDVAAAILAGQELGLPPMATLRSVDVIQGTPGLRAHAMRGLVQSKGHEIELVDATPAKCVMRGRRKGAENWQQVEWTIERAQQLGLTNKDQWRKQPQTMLIARATGEICRLIASDVLYGMPYAAEELSDSRADEQDTPPRVTAGEILQRDAADDGVDPDAGGPADDDPDADAAKQWESERESWPADDDPWAGIPVAAPGGES